jgi:hypothetical protein
MEEIQQAMLVLINRDTQLVNLAPEILHLRTPGKVSHVLDVLQRSTDLGTVRFDLGSDVIERRLNPLV